jgi:hypothetical protein
MGISSNGWEKRQQSCRAPKRDSNQLERRTSSLDVVRLFVSSAVDCKLLAVSFPYALV